MRKKKGANVKKHYFLIKHIAEIKHNSEQDIPVS